MDLPPSSAPDFPPPAPLAATAALFDALPWGVLVLDAQGIIQHINQQAATWCGVVANALVGQPLAEAPLPPALGAVLQQLQPEAGPHEVWLPGTQQWLSLRTTPDPAGQRWLFLDNVTAQHQAEAARQRSSQLLLDMEAVAHTGSYEADLLSGSFYFSDGMYRLFGEAPQAFVVTLEAIDARSHPDDAAAVRQVLDEAVRTKHSYTYRRRIRRADGEWRTLEAHGEVRTDAAGQAVQLRGLVQDITERVQAEAALHEGRTLLRATIDSSLDMVQVFEAVRDEQGTVVDFTWVLNNAASEGYYGNVIGQRLCQLNPGVVEEGIFDTFRQVLETGVPDQHEHHYVHEQFDGWFYQSTVKLGDGVTTTTHDITARKQAEQELRETKELLQSTLDSSHHVVQAFKAVRDAQGAIVDFTWLLTNHVWEKQYGGPMTGKSLLQENPGVVETGLFAKFVQVTETGVPVDHEQYYAHEQFDAWFHQTLVRMGDGFVMNTIEITERKQAQAELISLKEQLAQQAQDRYHSLFHTMEEGVSILEMLYDDHDQPVDMRWVEVNPAFERITGLTDVAGKRTSTVVPTEQYWLNAYDSVVKTGKALRYENYHAGVQQWCRTHTSRIGGPESRIVANVFEDITEHKRHEAQQRQAAAAETFRRQLADALGPLVDAVAIQEVVTHLARQHFAADRCYYCEIERGQAIIRRDAATEGLPSVAGTYPLANFALLQAVIEAGRPFIVRDVRADESVDDNLRQLCVQLQVISYLDVPVIKNGQPVGVLCLVQSTPREWTAAETALAAEVAERAWAAVERARTETDLRESEEKLRTVFDSIDEGFALEELVYDAQGEIEDIIFREVNQAYERQGGLTNVVGKSIKEVLPHLEQHWKDVYAQVARTGEPVRLVNYAQDVNRWFDTYITLLAGSKQYVAVVFNDITEQKRHEQRQAFLLQFSDALRAEPSVDAVANRALALLSEQLELDRSYITTYYPHENRAYVDYQLGNDRVAPLPAYFVLSDYPEAYKTTASQTVVIEDDFERPGLTEAERRNSAQLGMRAMVGATLRRENNPLWSLVAINARPRRWTPGEISLIEEAAERTWAAVERARAEAALRASEEKYRGIFENIDQGFSLHELLVDETGQVTDVILREVNEAFEKHTGIKHAQGRKVSELVPNLEPVWLDAMTRAYKLGETQQFEAYNVDTNRWITSQYSRLGGAGSRLLTTVFTDITERKQREQHREFLLKLSDALRPLTDPLEIQQAAMRVLGEQLGADRALYAEISSDEQFTIADNYVRGEVPKMTGRFPLSAFGRLADAQRAGELTVVHDMRDAGESDEQLASYLALGVQAILGIPLHKGGRWLASVAVHSGAPRRWTPEETAMAQETAERTWAAVERALAQQALAASEQRLRALITSLPGAAAFVVGSDLRYQLAGGEALDAAGLGPADLLGRTIAEAMPPELVPQHEAHYRQALAGQGFSLEHTAHGRTYITRGVPLLDTAGQPEAVLAVSYDITARKRAEEALQASEARLAEFNSKLEERVARRTQQLQASRDLLQSVLDTSLVSMSVMEAVRDEAGEVQDFRLRLVNQELARATGRTDLVGKLYAQEYPGIRQLGLFDLMLKALATNQPQGMEYFYDQEGFSQWYACQFVKLGDGVVATSLDITERKTAEQELLKSLRLLEQAEAVAGLGSWDYDLATGVMRWSEGMYQLVALPLGQPISPNVYLQLVVNDDWPRAEQLVRQLTAGKSVEETLRLQVGEHVKTVRLKAVVLRDETGRPVRVLGVDLDISELQRLEADNLHLRLGQQQALFEAVQAAEEEERRRMSESLHNGIGQLLYATKLQLDRLPTGAASSPQQRAAELLSEAIRQTRALSHELTPAILEEYGLEATLRSMCSSLSTPALRWHCHLVVDEGPALSPSLQLAVYRLAQELAQNVLKHAHATDATLEVEVLPAWVVLRVEDNGRGFDLAQTSDGLGLRTLRSRAALLGGSVQVTTAPAQGTQCQVRLPLPT